MRNTILQAIVDVLRDCPNTSVIWGEMASPFYQEVPEPPPKFPYVVIDIPDSTIEHTIGDPAYTETYVTTINVVDVNVSGLSPYKTGSVLHYLDSFRDNSSVFNGDIGTFTCEEFLRQSWVLKLDTSSRDSAGGRVWIASANYEILLMIGGEI